MSLIDFPNVPNVDGVPALPRLASGSAIASTAIGIVAGIIWKILQGGNQWGIYDSSGKALGNPAILGGILGSGLFSTIAGTALNNLGITESTSTGSVDYSKEMRVSSFPVEGGKFASYNKVELPGEPIVTLLLGGSVSDRTGFINAIDSACKSLNPYSVATPEVTYTNHTIKGYRYSREALRGANMFAVELRLEEIRTVSAVYSQSQVNAPKTASAIPQADSGKVQATAPQTSTLKSLSTMLPKLF